MNKILLILLIILNLSNIKAAILFGDEDPERKSCNSFCCIDGICADKTVDIQKSDIYLVLDKTYRMKNNFNKIESLIYYMIFGIINLNSFNNELVSNSIGIIGYTTDDYDISNNYKTDGDFEYDETEHESFNSKANNIPMEKAFKNGCDFLLNNTEKEKKSFIIH
ncbi:hypothetical protein BCR32DRAFT_72540 [Anaeromyces robustus]|uniref:VWFA domain-containing protein n=1 Tax=Anaeromyces robustus TaxID=1754192 RepID=A0A1Y1WSZ8_9FUNG|nr:hypothetical protein BCR32DRAFT_72540 [Anaeromyces robustus]|eukprot:ORX76670.1 hypothetical protein BCR32DRAFT_72540 [Anaeromyces robustus]